MWTKQPTRSKSVGWSLVRWAVNIQSCCCSFTVSWRQLTGADILPDCALLPSGKQIAILLGSEKINAFYQSVPIAYIFPTWCLKGHCYFSARLNVIQNSVTVTVIVRKGKRGGGLPTPPAPMQTYGTWLIAVLQREGWPAAKHIAKGLSSSCWHTRTSNA